MLDLPAKRAMQLLAAAAVLLAAGCVALAWAWTGQRDEAACWREAFESGDPPAEGVC